MSDNNQVMSVKDWMITIFITFIPLVGLIMLFVWAFGSDTNVVKANWAKAKLIWVAISVVFVIITWSIIGAFLLAMASEMGHI